MTLRPTPGRSPYYVEIIAWGEGNNRIYNNVFYGEGKRGGISLNSFNNRVHHNTFVGSAYGIEFHTGKTGNQVTNNIFQDTTTSFLRWPAKALPQTLDYNVYYNVAAPPRWQRDGVAYDTFSAYQQAAGEVHSRYEEPRQINPPDAGPALGARATKSEPEKPYRVLVVIGDQWDDPGSYCIDTQSRSYQLRAGNPARTSSTWSRCSRSGVFPSTFSVWTSSGCRSTAFSTAWPSPTTAV